MVRLYGFVSILERGYKNMKNETKLQNELKMIMIGNMKKDGYFFENEKPVINVTFAEKGAKDRPLVRVFNGKQLTLDSFTEDDTNGGFQALDVVVNSAVFDLYGHSEGMDYCSRTAILKYKKLQK
tara:strand:+ start:124 stop:498 length:375 start_codon:yes stop_codon:yes gene_type:complete